MRGKRSIKRIILIMLLVIMLFSIFPSLPFKENGKVYGTTIKAKTTDVVNVRNDAGASKTKLGTLAKGKTFNVLGVKKDSEGIYWYKTTYNSKTAYISSKYAVRTGYTTNSIKAEKGVATNTGTNIRLGPGTGYLIIATTKKGQTFTVNGKSTSSDGKVWYRCAYDGLKVYISSTYMKFTKAQQTATTQTSQGVKAKATAKVNVRSDAGASKKKLGTLDKGKTFNVLGVKKDSEGIYWYKTTYNSKTAYISSKYAVRTGYTTNSIKAEKGVATNTGTNIRLGPGTGYLIIATTKKGQAFTVNGKSTSSDGKVWYRCAYDGLKVYISSTYIKLGDLSLSNITYPTTIVKGKSFTLSGNINALEKMEMIETGITSASGTWQTGFRVVDKPKSTSYDISKKVDGAIKFGKLSAGTYYYRCDVTMGNKKKNAFNYKFVVSEAPVVTTNGITYPTILSQYKSFTLKGTVKSTMPITSLTLGITSSGGEWKKNFYSTVKPNTKSYDLAKLDNNIKFGSLPTGSYNYKCVITTGAETKTVFNYSFVVNKNTGIPSTKSYGNLSGKGADDIVKIAMAQNGYTTNKENHTAYNLWFYGKDQSAAWCAIFVSWCANQANVSTGVIPKMAYVPSVTAWYQAKGKFNAKKTLPKKGDLIIYKDSSHIGIVTKTVTSNSGKVSTIEGNTGSDEVKYRENYMLWNSSAIKGYCQPAY